MDAFDTNGDRRLVEQFAGRALHSGGLPAAQAGTGNAAQGWRAVVQPLTRPGGFRASVVSPSMTDPHPPTERRLKALEQEVRDLKRRLDEMTRLLKRSEDAAVKRAARRGS